MGVGCSLMGEGYVLLALYEKPDVERDGSNCLSRFREDGLLVRTPDGILVWARGSLKSVASLGRVVWSGGVCGDGGLVLPLLSLRERGVVEEGSNPACMVAGVEMDGA